MKFVLVNGRAPSLTRLTRLVDRGATGLKTNKIDREDLIELTNFDNRIA
jgi:hypothetical protein